MISKGNAIDCLLTRFYGLAIEALPHWFRRRWAAEMKTTFTARLREARHDGGAAAVLVVGSREIGSVTLAAARSRFEQATGRVHRAHDAQDGSDVWRTDPVPALFIKDDRRSLKLACAGALLFHFALFSVVLPEANTDPVHDPVIIRAPLAMYHPPEPPEKIFRERVVRKGPRVPIPDPTPDDPEPLMASEIVYEFVASDRPEANFYVAPPAAPPPPIRGRVRAGADVRAPTIVRKIDPIYPELARRARLECTVILQAVIGTDGAVVDIEVRHGCGLGLDDSAIDAVARWRYTPTLLNGRPVEVVAIVRVVFKLS